jgi:hypothetical protein
MPYCPNASQLAAEAPHGARAEAVSIQRDPYSDAILIRVVVARYDYLDAPEMIVWLSRWWLRWVGHFDCSFKCEGGAWVACCTIAPHQSRCLTPTLQDLLAIRNAVCMYEIPT